MKSVNSDLNKPLPGWTQSLYHLPLWFSICAKHKWWHHKMETSGSTPLMAPSSLPMLGSHVKWFGPVVPWQLGQLDVMIILILRWENQISEFHSHIPSKISHSRIHYQLFWMTPYICLSASRTHRPTNVQDARFLPGSWVWDLNSGQTGDFRIYLNTSHSVIPKGPISAKVHLDSEILVKSILTQK